MRVESPPFTPDAQFHVSLSEGRGEVLDFGLELLLAAVRRPGRAIASSEALGAAVEELTLPLGDRRLTHLQPPGDLGLGGLAAQDAQYDLQLLLGRIDGFASHERLLSGAGEPMINGSPTNRDTLQIDYLYDENGVPYAGVYRSPASSTSPVVFGMVTSDRGDVLELLDTNGNAFACYHYDAWGNAVGGNNDQWGHATGITTASTSLIASQLAADIAGRQVLRYAGYVYDPESYLYYCSARFYDPATRQFTTADPDKADGEESAYQYCDGDPIGMTDPSGEKYENSYGPSWCGWVESDKAVCGAEGTLTARRCYDGGPAEMASDSAWVGVGGMGPKKNLVQAGVDMSNPGKLVAWWEYLDPKDPTKSSPNGQEDLPSNRRVRGGDRIDVRIVPQGDGLYGFHISNTTKHHQWSYSIAWPGKPTHTADWIVETGRDNALYPGMDEAYGEFKKVAFSGCRWCTAGGVWHNMTYGTTLWRCVDDMEYEQNTALPDLYPSDIGSNDTSFSVKSATYLWPVI